MKLPDERLRALFSHLDLERPELDAAHGAWQAGDRDAAAAALLAHFAARAPETAYRMDPVTPGVDIDDEAEAILADRYTFQNVSGTPPRDADGVLDWTHTGPNDDAEWAFFLNRHGHLGHLLQAYARTGNRRYAQRIDADLREWVQANGYPGEPTRDPRWRGLETMARVAVWARIFYGLAADPLLSPEARLSVLSSIPEHAHYLRHFHAGGGNWLAMQMTALATAGLAWPEFRDAESWIAYARDALVPQLSKQVYPDGVQKELTSHYHGATLTPFQRFADLFADAGRALPPAWNDCLERMWSYWADSLRPDGHGALNNDSNLDFNRPRLLAVWPRYARPDWAWIASNGQEGMAPVGPPSRFLPWAGQLISRSGFDADAHWSFFDVGPWGIGHQHQDKLHLSVAAFGVDLLVDAGRLYYKRDAWRDHVCGTRAHNTLLLDGCEQQPDAKEAEAPVSDDDWAITEGHDFARAAFTAGYEGLQGEAVHTRAVVYLRGRGWLVVDHVTGDRPRSVDALWHFHPECQVRLEGATAVARRGDAALHVIPLGDTAWSAALVRGQEQPVLQGWYSREYNHKAPAPCVTATTSCGQTRVFVWLLWPARGDAVPPRATLAASGPGGVTVVVAEGSEGGGETTVTIPLDEGPVTVT